MQWDYKTMEQQINGTDNKTMEQQRNGTTKQWDNKAMEQQWNGATVEPQLAGPQLGNPMFFLPAAGRGVPSASHSRHAPRQSPFYSPPGGSPDFWTQIGRA